MNQTVYLGGAFAQFSPEQVEARQHEVEALLHTSIKVLKPRHQGGYSPSLGAALEATLTTRDLLMVRAANVLILDCLNATSISRGSVIEMGWASALQKPFVIIAEEGNPHSFNMSRSLTPFIVPTRAQAAEIVNTLLT